MQKYVLQPTKRYACWCSVPLAVDILVVAVVETSSRLAGDLTKGQAKVKEHFTVVIVCSMYTISYIAMGKEVRKHIISQPSDIWKFALVELLSNLLITSLQLASAKL